MHGSTHHHCSWMSRSFSVHTVCVCALFCRVIMCWSLVASNLPVTTHTHTSTHKHTHRPVGCWGAGSASLWASSECQLPAAVCAERTVQRKRNVFPHPSASLCTAEACCSTVTPHWTLLWLTHTHTHTVYGSCWCSYYCICWTNARSQSIGRHSAMCVVPE